MPVVFRNTPGRKHSTLASKSLAALRLWLSDEWTRRIESPKLTVVYADGLEADRQADLESGHPEGTPGARYPWVALVPVSIQERTNGLYHPWAVQRLGIPLGKVNGNTGAVFEMVRPVDIGVALRLRCFDIQEAMAFATIWMETLPSFSVDIRNAMTGRALRINYSLDTSVSLPQGNRANGGVMEVDTTVICHTYVGTTESTPTIRDFNVNINTSFGSDAFNRLYTLAYSGADRNYVMREQEA